MFIVYCLLNKLFKLCELHINIEMRNRKKSLGIKDSYMKKVLKIETKITTCKSMDKTNILIQAIGDRHTQIQNIHK